jgi:hypothetical protein
MGRLLKKSNVFFRTCKSWSDDLWVGLRVAGCGFRVASCGLRVRGRL